MWHKRFYLDGKNAEWPLRHDVIDRGVPLKLKDEVYQTSIIRASSARITMLIFLKDQSRKIGVAKMWMLRWKSEVL